MGLGYQRRDLEVIDYQIFSVSPPNSKRHYLLRGPQPNFVIDRKIISNHYFADVGAAFSFGCYVPNPYGRIVQERIGIPTLNLGISGAGPLHFLLNPDLIKLINQSRFAVINVMSGRSESNHLFDSRGKEMYRRRSNGEAIAASNAYQELLDDKDLLKAIVRETRQNWVDNYSRLLTEIKVPKILFWFSTRKPKYKERHNDIHSLFGAFPQLVNSDMVKKITNFSDLYGECITSSGLPQKLYSRFTNGPIHIQGRKDLGNVQRQYNRYYASPEMHAKAAETLVPLIRKLGF